MPRRFLFVTQYFPPEVGAAQVRLGAITRDLIRRGNEVEVLTAIPNYPTGRLFPGWSRVPVQKAAEDGFLVRRVWIWSAMGSGFSRLVNFLSFGIMSTISLPATKRADWTIVEYPTLFGALPAVAWCRIRRRAVAVTVADLWVDTLVAVGTVGEGLLLRLLHSLERWMLRQADAVNALTEGVREGVIAKGVDQARLCWLPNGADTTMFAPGPGLSADREALGLREAEYLFVYAGTQGYVHGLDVVLDAAEKLRAEPVKFLLVGGGSERERLRASAEDRSLTNVTFWDPVPPNRVADLLRLATAGLACTRAGTVYRSIRSAKMLPVMASGRPVLYSGEDEGASLVASVGAGIAVAAGDGAALADAIRLVVDDPAEAARMGERGRQYVVAHASWEAIVGRWLHDLEALPRVRGRSA